MAASRKVQRTVITVVSVLVFSFSLGQPFNKIERKQEKTKTKCNETKRNTMLPNGLLTGKYNLLDGN